MFTNILKTSLDARLFLRPRLKAKLPLLATAFNSFSCFQAVLCHLPLSSYSVEEMFLWLQLCCWCALAQGFPSDSSPVLFSSTALKFRKPSLPEQREVISSFAGKCQSHCSCESAHMQQPCAGLWGMCNKAGSGSHPFLIFLVNFGPSQVYVSQECRMQTNVTDRLRDEW